MTHLDPNPGQAPAAFVEFVCGRLAQKAAASAQLEALQREVQASLRWCTQDLTLLCAEPASADADPLEAEALAALAWRHGGMQDECSPAAVLAGFADPGDALQAAMAFQRQSRSRRRVALVAGGCVVADFRFQGRRWRALIGSDITRAEELARRVPAGTVQLSPETFPMLEPHFDSGQFEGLVTAEFVDEQVMEASITMAPARSAALSTFAGLGLTA